MWLFSWLFEVATAPLSIVADICTMWNAGWDESFTKSKARAIDEAFRD